MYTIHREGDRWVFIPSSTFGFAMTLMFIAGSLFMVYLSAIFFRGIGASVAMLGIGACFLAVAAFSASLARKAWCTRRIPLIIAPGGRIAYGPKEICAAGTVQAVQIVESRTDEGGCEIGFEVAGSPVFVPSQYFAHFGAREHARPFAAVLAEALQVQVKEIY